MILACPSCKHLMMGPDTPPEIKLQCNHCGQHYVVTVKEVPAHG